MTALKEHLKTDKRHTKVQEQKKNYSLDAMFAPAKPKPLPSMGTTSGATARHKGKDSTFPKWALMADRISTDEVSVSLSILL